MSARSLKIKSTYSGLKSCADPDCVCEPNVVQAGKRALVGHVVLEMEGEEMRLCLLCYFARQGKYRGRGWNFKEQLKVDSQ